MITKIESIEQTLDLVSQGKLEAHPAFMATPISVLLEVCNGCGAAGAKFDFVPDTIYGLSIRPACNIHDFDYDSGTDWHHKRRADIRFLVNCILIILPASNWVTTILRVERAVKYFLAVTLKGNDAYQKGKNL